MIHKYTITQKISHSQSLVFTKHLLHKEYLTRNQSHKMKFSQSLKKSLYNFFFNPNYFRIANLVLTRIIFCLKMVFDHIEFFHNFVCVAACNQYGPIYNKSNCDEKSKLQACHLVIYPQCCNVGCNQLCPIYIKSNRDEERE